MLTINCFIATRRALCSFYFSTTPFHSPASRLRIRRKAMTRRRGKLTERAMLNRGIVFVSFCSSRRVFTIYTWKDNVHDRGRRRRNETNHSRKLINKHATESERSWNRKTIKSSRENSFRGRLISRKLKYSSALRPCRFAKFR